MGSPDKSLSNTGYEPKDYFLTETYVEFNQESITEHAQIRTLLDRQREQILADCQVEIRKNDFQADNDRRNQKLSETIESQQEELHRAQAEELHRRDQQLLQGQFLQQNLELREAHQRSLTEMEELRKFQSSTFDTMARRILGEDQNTILELSARMQELQNEVNCMNDSQDFQDAESIRSGNSHVTSRSVSFPPHPIPERMLRHSFVSPSRKEGSPSIWDTHGISGNFLQIQQRLLQHLILKNCINGIRHSRSRSILLQWKRVEANKRSRSEMPVRTVSRKNQSSPVREILQRIMEQTNNHCRFWIFTLTNSLHQTPHLLAGGLDSRPRYVLVHNFVRKLCCGSKKWSWLIQWTN